MSEDIDVRKDVPTSALDEVVNDYKADGASVVVTAQGGGLYTVIATFPDAGAPRPAGGGAPAAGGAGPVAPPEPPDDPAPFAAFAAAGTNFWPVVDPGPNTRLVSYHPSPDKTIGNIGRCFFDDRPGRHHVGVDLFAEEGDPVVACADGKIVSFYKFYNSKGRDTFALVIAHDESRHQLWRSSAEFPSGVRIENRGSCQGRPNCRAYRRDRNVALRNL